MSQRYQVRAKKDQLQNSKQDVLYRIFEWSTKSPIIVLGKVQILLFKKHCLRLFSLLYYIAIFRLVFNKSSVMQRLECGGHFPL